MTTVWILTTGWKREGENVQGVYSSLEAAKAARDALHETDRADDFTCIYDMIVDADPERRYVGGRQA